MIEHAMIELVERYQIRPDLDNLAIGAIPAVAKRLGITQDAVVQTLNDATIMHLDGTVLVSGEHCAATIAEWFAATYDDWFGVIQLCNAYKVWAMCCIPESQQSSLVHVAPAHGRDCCV